MNIIEKLGVTPGPWEHSEDTVWNEELDYGIVETGQYDDVRKEAESNMSLIASAPEMLKALIEACSTFEWYTELHYKKHGVGHDKYATNKGKFDYLKAVIGKATGKTWPEIKELLDE